MGEQRNEIENERVKRGIAKDSLARERENKAVQQHVDHVSARAARAMRKPRKARNAQDMQDIKDYRDMVGDKAADDEEAYYERERKKGRM